jgi:hypothetical protein
MGGVGTAEGTELFKFKLLRSLSLILGACIVSLLTVCTS